MSSGGPSFKQSSDTVNHRSNPPLGDSTSRHAAQGTKTAEATTASKEETFSLVPGGGSDFSTIIKLTPSLMDEMKRVEAEGGKARIKFDSDPDTSGGNLSNAIWCGIVFVKNGRIGIQRQIIEVGGREFKFMWSRDVGDLCDIYEEFQNGEDGNGLLVESGCAWRKLNVQRILDESTKKHVKKMSQEAERKLRSRGTLVLEPGNPSMKSLAPVEAASQKKCNIKKEAALKKRSMKNFQVGGSSKSTHAPGSSSITAFKGQHSSPLSFIPDQPTASSLPLGAVNIHKITDDSMPSQMIGKPDGNAGCEKGLAMIFNATEDISRGKANDIAKPIDLQSMLISLLRNKPHGLTLKALEKAVQGIVPNPLEKIKPILRNIARYKSPGRYILLQGVDFERLNKPQAEIGSSSNGNHSQKAAPKEFCDHSAPSGGFKGKVPNVDLEEQVRLNSNAEDNTLEKINDQHVLPYIFAGEKGSDHSKGLGGGKSDGESGSECDASFKNKEGFNEDVDIMSIDEEKEPKHKTEPSETHLAKQLERNLSFKHGKNRANPSEKVKLKVADAERAKKFGVRQGIELEGCSQSNTRAPTNLLEEVAGRGKDPIIAVENNGDRMGQSSDDDDSRRYFKYEKNEPEFKGPIKTMAQYQQYVKEYNEKYPDYASLLRNVEGFRSNFEQLCNDLEKAKKRDENRYLEILGQIKETYEHHVPHHKRLKMIFVVLHKELEHMKQMISDFANGQNKKNARNKRR